MRNEKRTTVFMDTPYRLVALLKDIVEVYGNDRRIVVAFNLTMPDEKVHRGTAIDIFRYFEKRNMKGEFVIVVEGARGRE